MDLQKLIAELMEAGVSQGEIAKAMRCTQATVSRYRTGEIKTCNYQSGAALIELHLLRAPQPPAKKRIEARPR